MSELLPPTAEQVKNAETTLAYVLAHRDAIDMNVWLEAANSSYGVDLGHAESCGTTGCFAGWGALLAGHKVKTYCGVVVVDTRDDNYEIAEWGTGHYGVSQYYGTGSHLFAHNNTMQDMCDWVRAIRVAHEQNIPADLDALEVAQASRRVDEAAAAIRQSRGAE